MNDQPETGEVERSTVPFVPLDRSSEARRGGGYPVWTGAWAWGRPVPFTGEWVEATSDEAAQGWDDRLWHRFR